MSAAFGAGMVATFNPCGFAMLPAYLGLFLGGRAGTRLPALRVGLTVSAGFAIVFAVFGILITAGVRAIIHWLPWMAILVGLGLLGFGIAQLRGRRVGLRLPRLHRSGSGRSTLGLAGFGASYGIASLSCTLPIFLSLVAGAIAGRGFVESLAVFLAYAAGMSLVVVAITLALAAGRERAVARLRRISPHLDRISGSILVLAGAFIVLYWATVLSVGATALSANPLARLAEEASGAIARAARAHPAAVAIIVAAGAVASWALLRSRSSDREDRAETVSGKR